jgi:SAM-dependent methyltransferase
MMRPDVTTLADYYASHAGRKIVAAIAPLVAPLLQLKNTDRLLGLGFTQPFLPSSGPLVVQACPALQGVMRWPTGVANRACLVDEKYLPFTDSLFDQILLMHSLEYAKPTQSILRELWRVLAPGGKILLLVPNCKSLYWLINRSPFATGHRYCSGLCGPLLVVHCRVF